MRCITLFVVFGVFIVRAMAVDVTLPDSVRIGPRQVVRMQVAGTLPRLAELTVLIRYSPGIAKVYQLSGRASYAVTCRSFVVLEDSIGSDTALVRARCTSSGAGVHDTLFAIELEGVWSTDTVGFLQVVGLELDGTPIPVTSNITKLIRDGAVQGAPSTPTIITGNYPNPFSTTTTVSFSVDKPQSVTINVRTLQGRLIRSYPEVPARAGEQEITMNFLESDIGSGRYIVELITAEGAVFHAMAVMR